MIEALANPVSVSSGSSPRVRFAVAGSRDDASIRHLLRTNPMNGAIRLTFEREPDYFRSYGLGGAADRTIVAYEDERLVCMGRTSARRRFVNGQACSVGYLGELRLAQSAQGRFDILRRGYRFFRELEDSVDSPALWFTSIASDNHRSLRFLERNLPGMPRYDFVGEFVTVLVAVPGRLSLAERRAATALKSLRMDGYRMEPASIGKLTPIAQVLNEHGMQAQLSSEWTSGRLESLARHGLAFEDWLCLSAGSELVACAALWDQRGFRQTVVRGYSGGIAAGRLFFNPLAAMLGRPKLPPVNSVLAHAFLSPIGLKPGHGSLLTRLVDLCLPMARRRGLDFLTLGFAAPDLSLSELRDQFSCREYRSRLYRVRWRNTHSGIILEKRPIAPEVALL
jgi:hypothetical protein